MLLSVRIDDSQIQDQLQMIMKQRQRMKLNGKNGTKTKSHRSQPQKFGITSARIDPKSKFFFF